MHTSYIKCGSPSCLNYWGLMLYLGLDFWVNFPYNAFRTFDKYFIMNRRSKNDLDVVNFKVLNLKKKRTNVNNFEEFMKHRCTQAHTITCIIKYYKLTNINTITCITINYYKPINININIYIFVKMYFPIDKLIY